MEPKFSFCLNDYDSNDREYMLKISSQNFELNILLSKDELSTLPEVVTARWNDRTCLMLGECLSAPAWWSLNDHGLSILIGDDDES